MNFAIWEVLSGNTMLQKQIVWILLLTKIMHGTNLGKFHILDWEYSHKLARYKGIHPFEKREMAYQIK